MLASTYSGGQEAVIRLMQALGYRSNKQGVCAGVTMMFVLAFLSGKVAAFTEAMKLIHTDSDLPGIIREFQSRRAAAATQHAVVELTAQESIILDVLALLDGIEIFHQPEFYREWFGQPLCQLDINKISRLMVPGQSADKSSLCKIADWFGMYSRNDLNSYMCSLAELAQTGDVDLAFTFDNTIHKISLCYDAGKKYWMLCNPNAAAVKIYQQVNPPELVEIVFAALLENRKSEKGSCAGFVTTVYALDNARPAVESAVARLKNSALFEIAHELLPRKIAAQTLNGVTLAHLAAYAGHRGYINLLANCGFNFNAATVAGFTPLHLAAFKGSEQLIRTMVRAGADCNLHTKIGIAPIHIAAEFGHAECIRALAEGKADLNILTMTGDAAIHIAAEYGHASVCAALADLKADLNLVSKDGYTASRLAEMFNRKEVQEKLAQADMKARFFQAASPNVLRRSDNYKPYRRVY